MPRPLSPVDVLSVLIQRMERTAESLDQVKLSQYDIAVKELRRYTKMMRAARDYLREQGKFRAEREALDEASADHSSQAE